MNPSNEDVLRAVIEDGMRSLDEIRKSLDDDIRRTAERCAEIVEEKRRAVEQLRGLLSRAPTLIPDAPVDVIAGGEVTFGYSVDLRSHGTGVIQLGIPGRNFSLPTLFSREPQVERDSRYLAVVFLTRVQESGKEGSPT